MWGGCCTDTVFTEGAGEDDDVAVVAVAVVVEVEDGRRRLGGLGGRAGGWSELPLLPLALLAAEEATVSSLTGVEPDSWPESAELPLLLLLLATSVVLPTEAGLLDSPGGASSCCEGMADVWNKKMELAGEIERKN